MIGTVQEIRAEAERLAALYDFEISVFQGNYGDYIVSVYFDRKNVGSYFPAVDRYCFKRDRAVDCSDMGEAFAMFRQRVDEEPEKLPRQRTPEATMIRHREEMDRLTGRKQRTFKVVG